jgi:hypothetical protein
LMLSRRPRGTCGRSLASVVGVCAVRVFLLVGPPIHGFGVGPVGEEEMGEWEKGEERGIA